MSNGNFGTAVMPVTKSSLDRIIGIFTSPSETLEDVAARPSFLVPLLAIIMVYALTGVFTLELDARYGLEKMSNMKFMTPEMIAEAEKRTEEKLNSPSRYLDLLYAPIFIGIAWLIMSAAFMLVGNVILGGEAKFKTIFSITAWAELIGGLERIVKTALGLAKESKEVVTSPAIVLPLDQSATWGFNLLNRFDIFTIWLLIVLISGIAAVYKFSRGKSAAMVISLWVLWSAIFLPLNQLLGGMLTFSW
jgi:hypothetical protein